MRIFIALLVALAVITGVADAAAARLVPAFPEPTGPYEIGSTQLHLVDHGRRDAWEPERARELMVTVTYPARHAWHFPRAAWFSPVMAAFLHEYFAEQPTNVPAGSVDFAAARAHSRVGAPVAKRPQVWPVLLYSHALGLSRELAAAQVEDLASHGYVVVSVDHTYEASAVQFPGGRVASRLPEVFARDVRRKLALDTRVADIRFVLDRLTELAHGRNPDAEHRPLPARLRRALDLSRVGMIGYSYGGYTAGEAMYHDRRIDAGINLDGAMEHGWSWEENGPYLPGNVVTRGLDRPFLLFGSEGHNHLRPDLLRSWADFWPNQRGWKRDLTLHGSRHGSFSDLQTLTIDIGRAFDLPPGTLEPIYGTIDPERSIAVQRAYIAAFFDLHLRDRDVRLLAGPSPAYPEVEFVP